MSMAFSPPEEGDEIHDPDFPKRIRLSDIGQIAADRIDGENDIRPNERTASQTATAELMPDVAAAAHASAVTSVSHVGVNAAAEPASSAKPDELESVKALAQFGDITHASQTNKVLTDADRSEVMPIALVRTDDAHTDARNATTAAPQHEMVSFELAAHIRNDIEPLAASGAETPAGVALVDIAASEFLRRDGPASTDAAAAVPDAPVVQEATRSAEVPPGVDGVNVPADDLQGEPHKPYSSDVFPAARPLPTEPSVVQPPLTSALGAATQLAADANAAAEALENLKRLLERQLPNHPALSSQPLDELFTIPPPEPGVPPQPHQQSALEMADDELPAGSTPSLSRERGSGFTWRERRQFDIRGFMAGFALSWAIGAALYIYLTAG